jgi:periplasmic divalent cation tolerance protein
VAYQTAREETGTESAGKKGNGMEALLVFITASSDEEATRVTEALLAERLVACVNRVPGVQSEFWWQGTRDQATEVLLLAKTRRELWDRVLEAVRAVHSYEVVEAIGVPILEGNPDYLAWVAEVTAQD